MRASPRSPFRARNRSASSALARPGCMTLTATGFCSRASRARKTVAMPPCPSSRSIVYPGRACASRVPGRAHRHRSDVRAPQHLRGRARPAGRPTEAGRRVGAGRPPRAAAAEVVQIVHHPPSVHDQYPVAQLHRLPQRVGDHQRRELTRRDRLPRESDDLLRAPGIERGGMLVEQQERRPHHAWP